MCLRLAVETTLHLLIGIPRLCIHAAKLRDWPGQHGAAIEDNMPRESTAGSLPEQRQAIIRCRARSAAAADSPAGRGDTGCGPLMIWVVAPAVSMYSVPAEYQQEILAWLIQSGLSHRRWSTVAPADHQSQGEHAEQHSLTAPDATLLP